MKARHRPDAHEVLIHPERMRIVVEFLGRGGRTASELSEQLGDVPAATLYRHLALLTDAGILAVRATRAMRGALEKTYDLAVRPLLAMDDVARSPARFLQVVTTFAAMVVGDFTRYVQRTPPTKRGVDPLLRGYAVDATDDEFRALTASLERIVVEAAAAGARPAHAVRKRRFVYIAAVPEVEASR